MAFAIRFQRYMVEHWQDLVFTFGTVVFTIALIPALRQKRYPPKSTCFLTGSMLILYIVTDVTLELWLTALTTSVSAMIWIYMGVKQIGNNN